MAKNNKPHDGQPINHNKQSLSDHSDTSANPEPIDLCRSDEKSETSGNSNIHYEKWKFPRNKLFGHNCAPMHVPREQFELIWNPNKPPDHISNHQNLRSMTIEYFIRWSYTYEWSLESQDSSIIMNTGFSQAINEQQQLNIVKYSQRWKDQLFIGSKIQILFPMRVFGNHWCLVRIHWTGNRSAVDKTNTRVNVKRLLMHSIDSAGRIAQIFRLIGIIYILVFLKEKLEIVVLT
eukprot:26389_1